MIAISSEVYVVEDDPSVRTALVRLIEAAGHKARAFGSAKEFLENASQLGPGCLLLDVRLPDVDGIELYQQLTDNGPAIPAVFLSGFADVPTSVRAIKSGAVDFLPKPVPEEILLRAIDSALAAEERGREERQQAEELSRRYRSLTGRELEVMDLVLSGLMNKQIARALRISEKTVKVHRGHVMAKMGARRVAQLVQFAVRLGVGATMVNIQPWLESSSPMRMRYPRV